MAAYNKFNSFIDYLCRGKINLASDVIKVMLTNTAPPGTATKYSDLSANELAQGNGYTTGGAVAPNPTLTANNGTDTFAVGSTTFTSANANMGPFRYVVYYDSSAADQPLLGYVDYGSSITLNGAAGETFVAQPGAALLTFN